VKTNEDAAVCGSCYIKSSGAQGIYPMMYYSHNLHFIAMCSAMNGDYPEAKKSGRCACCSCRSACEGHCRRSRDL